MSKLDISQPSILIVEDHEGWQELYRLSLESHGYRVETASSYDEATHVLDHISFDVAIVDLKLNEDDPSNLDGIRVIEYIRDTEVRRTGIIIQSGHGNIELVKKAFKKYDVLDFLEKDRIFVRNDHFSNGYKGYHEELLEVVDDAVRKSKLLDEQKDIFMSYSRADTDVVKLIYKELVSKKHHPFMDIYSIKGGENWLRAIYKAIDECQIFLAVLSKNSVSRRGVIQKELKKALDKWDGMLPDDIYLIPIRIDDCLIPELLRHIQVLDWNHGRGKNKLLEAIEVGLAKRKEP